MKKFEYKHEKIYGDLDWELSKLGDEGWELFSINIISDDEFDSTVSNTYKGFEYFAKREKREEINHDRYAIINEFGEETFLHTNEIYVNIGNCAGDIWEKSLWKKTFIDYVDKEGLHTMYGVYKEFIPSGLFKTNNLEYSLEHLYHLKNF